MSHREEETVKIVRESKDRRVFGIYLSADDKVTTTPSDPENTYVVYVQGSVKGRPLMALRLDGELTLGEGWERHWFAAMFMEAFRALQAKASGVIPAV